MCRGKRSDGDRCCWQLLANAQLAKHNIANTWGDTVTPRNVSENGGRSYNRMLKIKEMCVLQNRGYNIENHHTIIRDKILFLVRFFF